MVQGGQQGSRLPVCLQEYLGEANETPAERLSPSSLQLTCVRMLRGSVKGMPLPRKGLPGSDSLTLSFFHSSGSGPELPRFRNSISAEDLGQISSRTEHTSQVHESGDENRLLVYLMHRWSQEHVVVFL